MANKEKTADGTILFFGHGYIAAPNLPEKHTLSEQIQTMVDSLALPYTCVQAGISGETSLDSKRRLEWAMESYEVDIILIEAGRNDLKANIPLIATEETLENMILQIKKAYPSVPIYLLSTPINTTMGLLYHKLAQKHQISLIPCLTETPEINISNSKMVKEQVWKVLEKVLHSNT
ncbi:hypothetical protein GCM10023331_32760 [Algivirga pacifica]|uniref:SGNH hydrolase-type esterase domain-containing protein n=1 Tax=Algivirga pacifica TaxID=1162670 RepID=A0ABP9DK25_9BACT